MNTLTTWLLRRLIKTAVARKKLWWVYATAHHAVFENQIGAAGKRTVSMVEIDNICDAAFKTAQSPSWAQPAGGWVQFDVPPEQGGFYAVASGDEVMLAAYGNGKWWTVKGKQWVDCGIASGWYLGPVAPADFQTPSQIEGSLAAKVMQQNDLLQQLYKDIDALRAQQTGQRRIGADLTKAAQVHVARESSAPIPVMPDVTDLPAHE